MSQDQTVERAIVLQVLAQPRSRAALEAQLRDIPPQDIDDALERLQAAGVVTVDGEQVSASPCARHLDALDLIAV
jgi:hypothetical protein